MKLRILGLAILIAATATLAAAQHGGKAEPRRIEFKRGTTTTSISDYVRNEQEAEYIFAARKGQKLTIQLTSTPRKSSVFDLHAPDNADLGLEYDANYNYAGVLPATGDYFLVVTRPTQTRGRSNYRLTITVK